LLSFYLEQALNKFGGDTTAQQKLVQDSYVKILQSLLRTAPQQIKE